MRLTDQTLKDINRAFKALEERNELLYNIREEIAEHADRLSDSLYGDGLRHALDIIDKYIAERSNEE